MRTGTIQGAMGPRHIINGTMAECGRTGTFVEGRIVEWALPLCDRCVRLWSERQRAERELAHAA